MSRIVIAATCCALSLPGVRPGLAASPESSPAGKPTSTREYASLLSLFDFQGGFALKPLVRAGYVSSYDRTGGNEDGFKGVYSSLYELPTGEHVIVDLAGPGCLYTLWFTGPSSGYRLPWGELRMYLDDEREPRLAMNVETLFSGEQPSFPEPLVANSFLSTGGHVSYVPIPFARRLVVTTQKRPGFYNAWYQLYPPGTAVTSWTGREDLSSVVAAWQAAGARPRISGTIHRGVLKSPAPGTFGELLNLQSSGKISSIWLVPVRPMSAATLNNLWLRIWWDGEPEPAVDVPVGPFFGSGQGEAAVRSLPIGMSPSGPYYCHFPMAFHRGARIVLENRGQEPPGDVYYEVAVVPSDSLVQKSGRFRAAYRQERPTTPGRDYFILERSSVAGLFLGHTLIVEPTSPENKKWWEGDLRIRVDGRRDPILNGTGHEDEFLGGWSSRWLQNPYSLPLHGLPSVVLLDNRPDRQKNGAISAYRFFAGGIPFRDGIRVSTEHGMENSVEINYASIAYWYEAAVPGMRTTDTLDVGDPASEQAHGYVGQGGEPTDNVAARFDGDEGLEGVQPLRDSGRRKLTQERFTLKLDPRNGGVLVRRLYHQAGGRHCAKLLIDGQPAGSIGTPDNNKTDRWHEEDVILGPAMTKGKSELLVEIQVESGEWNAFRYTVMSLLPD